MSKRGKKKMTTPVCTFFKISSKWNMDPELRSKVLLKDCIWVMRPTFMISCYQTNGKIKKLIKITEVQTEKLEKTEMKINLFINKHVKFFFSR